MIVFMLSFVLPALQVTSETWLFFPPLSISRYFIDIPSSLSECLMIYSIPTTLPTSIIEIIKYFKPPLYLNLVTCRMAFLWLVVGDRRPPWHHMTNTGTHGSPESSPRSARRTETFSSKTESHSQARLLIYS